MGNPWKSQFSNISIGRSSINDINVSFSMAMSNYWRQTISATIIHCHPSSSPLSSIIQYHSFIIHYHKLSSIIPIYIYNIHLGIMDCLLIIFNDLDIIQLYISLYIYTHTWCTWIIQIDTSKLNSLGIVHQYWLFICPNAYFYVIGNFMEFWWFLPLSALISTSPTCPRPKANSISFPFPLNIFQQQRCHMPLNWHEPKTNTPESDIAAVSEESFDEDSHTW